MCIRVAAVASERKPSTDAHIRLAPPCGVAPLRGSSRKSCEAVVSTDARVEVVYNSTSSLRGHRGSLGWGAAATADQGPRRGVRQATVATWIAHRQMHAYVYEETLARYPLHSDTMIW